MDRETYYYHYSGFLEDIICRLSGSVRKISDEELHSFAKLPPEEKLQLLCDAQTFVSENVPFEIIDKVFLHSGKS
ncbi:MAG: hypothetical protein FJ218_10775 [Ignavibacteria bacterium]|nr:hypothetical protein [Ignavibacteria bacterium]